MAQNSTAASRKIEAKALAAASKSEGMRMLYEAGYTVSQVTEVFEVPYGFAYGVASRGGFAAKAANRRAPRKGEAKVVKAQAKARGRKAQPVETVSATARVAAKIAKGKAAPVKAGRPSAARRQANRKVRAAK